MSAEQWDGVVCEIVGKCVTREGLDRLSTAVELRLLLKKRV